MQNRKIASDLSRQALADNTKYDPRELADAWTADVTQELYKSILEHKSQIEEWATDEICVGYVIGDDPLLVNLRRRKFFCWPYLLSPRPNQSVFLYNKKLDKITKRLWVLPDARTMAILATEGLTVKKHHKNMKRWSLSFFRGTFWEDIRKEHGIKMLSQQEFDALNREELIKAGLEDGKPRLPQPFDFSKISCTDVGDPTKPVAFQDV